MHACFRGTDPTVPFRFRCFGPQNPLTYISINHNVSHKLGIPRWQSQLYQVGLITYHPIIIPSGCVWKCCVPLNPMVLLIIIPFWKMAISLGRLSQHVQTNPWLSHHSPGVPQFELLPGALPALLPQCHASLVGALKVLAASRWREVLFLNWWLHGSTLWWTNIAIENGHL